MDGWMDGWMDARLKIQRCKTQDSRMQDARSKDARLKIQGCKTQDSKMQDNVERNNMFSRETMFPTKWSLITNRMSCMLVH